MQASCRVFDNKSLSTLIFKFPLPMKFEGEEIIRVALKVTAVCQGASFSVSGLCTDQIETSTPPSFHPPVQTVGI